MGVAKCCHLVVLIQTPSYVTMLIYKDLFTGDELASDSYPCQNIEGVIMQLEGKFITKGGEDFGIENNDEEGGDMEEAVRRSSTSLMSIACRRRTSPRSSTS